MGADPMAPVTGERPVGVAIVDDHPVVVEGFAPGSPPSRG